MGPLNAQEIVSVFNKCFALPNPIACRMLRGGDEPLYVPANAQQRQSYIYYARDLAQSCLHEAAHWLYAGSERRLLTDYGYWYEPDGRDEQAQRSFEQHEIAVQAREWILSKASCVPFRMSADNLRSPEPSEAFREGLYIETQHLIQSNWNGRMQILFVAFCEYTQQQANQILRPEQFLRDALYEVHELDHLGSVHV